MLAPGSGTYSFANRIGANFLLRSFFRAAERCAGTPDVRRAFAGTSLSGRASEYSSADGPQQTRRPLRCFIRSERANDASAPPAPALRPHPADDGRRPCAGEGGRWQSRRIQKSRLFYTKTFLGGGAVILLWLWGGKSPSFTSKASQPRESENSQGSRPRGWPARDEAIMEPFTQAGRALLPADLHPFQFAADSPLQQHQRSGEQQGLCCSHAAAQAAEGVSGDAAKLSLMRRIRGGGSPGVCAHRCARPSTCAAHTRPSVSPPS